MVNDMCNLLFKGGPDAGAVYVSSNQSVVLGNRRLALLDLSPAGNQPMSYKNRYFITYNGELYNHAILKKELQALGHQFNNQTDTEVILAAFAEWNKAAFTRLEGMFAFCIYDEIDQEVFLVRDPSGIKPLYYSTAFDSICFASEVRAFKALDFPWDSDPNWQVLLMAYGHIPEPYTNISQVRALHKGCYLKFDLNGRQSSLQSYFQYSFSSIHSSAVNAPAILRKHIDQAVASHMLADAPVGVFLSGGIDSSILALSAAQNTTSPVNCLSIYFNENDYSEKKYQDLILNTINGRSQQLLLDQATFTQALPEVMADMDLPSCDGINSWFISRQAKKAELKAVLSGLGADELMGGYPSFGRMGITRLLQYLPNLIKKGATLVPTKAFSRAEYLTLDGITGRYLFLRGQFPLREITRFLDADTKEITQILNNHPRLSELNIEDPKNEASWMEYHLYMQHQLLRDSDVMSMAHGVEIRVPFLDHRLVQWVMQLDPKIKYGGERPKQLLIDAFADLLPESIWNRSKMGFSFPFNEWLKGNAWAEAMVNKRSGKMETYYKNFLQGNLHWYQLMSLLIMSHRENEN